MDRHVDMGTEWYRAKILRTPKIQKTILPSGNLTVCYWTYPFIRRPLPTAGGARQRRDYKQQVLCSASEGQARGGQKGKPGAE